MNVTPLRPSTTPPKPAVITRTERATARIALYAAALLRNVDAVALRDLGIALATAATHDCIPRYSDNSHLVRIMQDLGWHKDGYAGVGRTRSPLYRRTRPTRPLS